MNYIDVYKRRISHLGNNPQERAFQSGILEFRRYLKYSRETEHNLRLNDSQETFSGVILIDKEDENRVSQILLTKLVEDGGPAIKPGDLLWWGDDSCPWLVYLSTTSSYQPHQKLYMVRCNYLINWLDKEGFLHNSWVYLLGSKDSKIKDNFRTWHSSITPQPNKHINIMMPHQLMPIGTEIMVLDEVWYLVDYDQNSVKGIVFMSFTETELNEQRDSIEEQIANIDQLAKWSIDMPDNRTVAANEIFECNYTVLKNGVAQNVIPTVTVSGSLTYLPDGYIQAKDSGSGEIIIDYKGISKTQFVTIGTSSIMEPHFIGDEKIRVGSINKYTLENVTSENIEFSIDDPNNLVRLKTSGNSCTIIANDKNKLGSFVLKVAYDGQEWQKNISIVSLWQVI